MTQPRVFTLQRDHDITGISGTGPVAHGVQWPDGTVTIRWTGPRPSTVNWNSIDDVIAINGHGGTTRIIWADGQPEQNTPPVAELLQLISDLHDPAPCRIDHRSYCETHDWFDEKTGCAHGRAQDLLPPLAAE